MVNNFNWFDEENEPAEQVEAEVMPEEESTPPPFYTENVVKPKKKKRFSQRPVAVAVLTSFITCIVLCGAFVVALPSITSSVLSDSDNRYYIESDRVADTSDNSTGATGTVQTGVALSNREIATKVGPSVVGVSNLGNAYGGMLNIDVTQGAGSGIILTADGYILTNNHVISGASSVKITLSSGETLDAQLVGTDAQTDIAVLKVDPGNIELQPATLGKSGDLQVGDKVFAIGNPLGQQLAGSFTHGVVSAVNRKITVDSTTYNLIQTDAAINSGNSGGALVNEYGEVIGINSVKIMAEGVEGLGFAIPIDDAKPIVEDLISVGYVKGRPMLGVEVVELDPQISYYYDLPVNYGLFINSVEPGSGAADAGLKVGDIIVGVNGEKVVSHDDLTSARDQFQAGDTMTLTINRDGEQKDFTIVLKEYKPSGGQQ